MTQTTSSQPLTFEEYLADNADPDYRYELVDGERVEMSPESVSPFVNGLMVHTKIRSCRAIAPFLLKSCQILDRRLRKFLQVKFLQVKCNVTTAPCVKFN
jgi:hypothetical protein